MHTKHNPHIYIILLNYNGSKNTIECLESLKKISYPDYSIVIVDNCSTDDSINELSMYFERYYKTYQIYSSPKEYMNTSINYPYVLQQSEHNGGYGNNIGTKYALNNDADYILILNNDTVVDPFFLEPLVEMCETDKKIGIASGKIYFYDRPDVIWFNGGNFYPCIGKVEHINFNEKDNGQVSSAQNTFISGCMWLIPSKVIEEIGYINEEYFMYVEDLKFSQRVLNHGFNLRVCYKSRIWHKIGSSSGGNFSNLSVYYQTKNFFKFTKTISNHLSVDGHLSLFSSLDIQFRLLKYRSINGIFIMIRGIKDRG